jgi:hypothetical protein
VVYQFCQRAGGSSLLYPHPEHDRYRSGDAEGSPSEVHNQGDAFSSPRAPEKHLFAHRRHVTVQYRIRAVISGVRGARGALAQTEPGALAQAEPMDYIARGCYTINYQ